MIKQHNRLQDGINYFNKIHNCTKLLKCMQIIDKKKNVQIDKEIYNKKKEDKEKNQDNDLAFISSISREIIQMGHYDRNYVIILC